MKPFTDCLNLLAIAALCLGVAGCNPEGSDSSTEPAPYNSLPDRTDAHSHAEHGPHGGDLIELGNEDYHAEMVHGDDDVISFYILGSDAKTAVPISATELIVNVTHDGKPEQFKLAASPDKGDPEGKSSRFISEHAELNEHLHEDHPQAKLVVDIEGKQYTGKIAHDHDAEHGHAH
ncbi:MAG TPA: hypothetical protein VLA12_22435 [Planctomycetaceae bacterium]|nr:hypothetical protein [Planctomycetaceae bacterium]